MTTRTPPKSRASRKLQIADEDSSSEEVVEINATGGFELPSPTEDDVLRKFETMDEDELIVEEVPVQGTKVAIDDDDSVEEVPVKTGGTKVAIEDSSEDEENLLVAETVPESLKPDPPSQGVKVAIEDDDDDDEPPPPDVSPAKSSDGSWEVVGDAAKAETLKGEGNELMKQGDVSGAVAKYSRPSRPTRNYASRANPGPWRAYAWVTWKALFWMPTPAASMPTLRQMSRSASKPYLGAATRAGKVGGVFINAEGQSRGAGGVSQDLDEVVALEPRNDVAVAKRKAVSEALSERLVRARRSGLWRRLNVASC